MPMPEATMDKDNCFEAFKDQVWFSWQAFVMGAKSETRSVDCSPHEHFGFGVVGFHGPHDVGSFLW